MKKIVYVLFVSFAFLIHGNTQEVSQTNAWYMYFGNHKLNDKWGLHTEYQFRRSGLIADWQQSLARVGLDYHLNKSTMLTGGYAWIVSFPYGELPSPTFSNEHRIWQQLILTQKSGMVSFQHRYRLEQRFLENASLNDMAERETDGYRFRQRARYRFLATVPLTKSAEGKTKLFAAAYEEVFLGFGEGIGVNILDQNRLYVGLGYKINDQINIQAGYLNHRVFKSDGVGRENNHTLNIGYTHNLDFTGGVE